MSCIPNGIISMAVKCIENHSDSLIRQLIDLLSPYDHDSFELSFQLPTVHLFEQFVDSIDIKNMIKENFTRFQDKLPKTIKSQSRLKVLITGDYANSQNDCKRVLGFLKTRLGNNPTFLLLNRRGCNSLSMCRKIVNLIRTSLDESEAESVEKELKSFLKSIFDCENGGLDINKFEFRVEKVENESVFFAGNYRKLMRGVSHSEWIINGKRKFTHSVEEMISNELKTSTKADAFNFASAGREDADVLMLGPGRLFLVELKNPKTCFALDPAAFRDFCARAQNSINLKNKGILEIENLRLANSEDKADVLSGENLKGKVYRCTVRSAGEIGGEAMAEIERMGAKGFGIDQQTPLRVLHRRALLTRKKKIFGFSFKAVANEEFLYEMTVRTSAGTYVKEFVHGDRGRTTPNVSEIAKVQCCVIELDVIGFCGENGE